MNTDGVSLFTLNSSLLGLASALALLTSGFRLLASGFWLLASCSILFPLLSGGRAEFLLPHRNNAQDHTTVIAQVGFRYGAHIAGVNGFVPGEILVEIVRISGAGEIRIELIRLPAKS